MERTVGITYELLDKERCKEIFKGYDDRLHIKDAAEMLQISVPKMRKLVKSGDIPATLFGKRYVFVKDHLVHYYITMTNAMTEEVNKRYEQR